MSSDSVPNLETLSTLNAQFYVCRKLHGFGGPSWWECSDRPLRLTEVNAWLARRPGGGIEFVGATKLLTPTQAWIEWMGSTFGGSLHVFK